MEASKEQRIISTGKNLSMSKYDVEVAYASMTKNMPLQTKIYANWQKVSARNVIKGDSRITRRNMGHNVCFELS